MTAQQFTGSDANETFALSNDDGLARVDIGGTPAFLENISTVELNPLGGADGISIFDLTGTDVFQVTVDLEGTLNGGASDGKLDTVLVEGSSG